MPIIWNRQLQGADRGDMLSQHTVIAKLFDVAIAATPHEGVVQPPTSFCNTAWPIGCSRVGTVHGRLSVWDAESSGLRL
jgi:hypothetical protein